MTDWWPSPSSYPGQLITFPLSFIRLKIIKTFEWTNKCEKAFKKLKIYLATPPILTRLEMGETLYLYLVASHKAVSLILIKEDNNN